jgi:hypothetical protein
MLTAIQFRQFVSRLLSKYVKIKMLWTTIPLIVLYGCQTWPLALRKKHRLKVFVNRVLRRISGPKRDKVTGGWRKLHKEELHNLYSSSNIIRMITSKRMRWTRHVARMGQRKRIQDFGGKSKRKITLGTRIRKWEDRRVDIRGIRWGRMDWTELAQDRDQWKRAGVSTVMSRRVPLKLRGLSPQANYSDRGTAACRRS